MRVSFSRRMNPENKDGIKISYAPARRKVSKAVWWLILTLVFAPFLWLLASLGARWLFISSPGVIAMDSYPVKAFEEGEISRIYVRAGESVAAGAPLAEMKRYVPEAGMAELRRVKAELEALSGVPVSAAALPRRSLGQMDSMVAHLANEERVMKGLMEKGAATRAEYNQAKERLISAQNEREALRVSLIVPLDQSAEVRKAYLRRYAEMLEEKLRTPSVIYAPRAGRVEYIAAAVGYYTVGELELMRIADPDDPYLIAYVFPENYDRRVRPGSVAKVHLPGSGRTIEATVVEPPLNANSIPGGISDTILSGRRSVVVFLKPNERLLTEESVNGMPVRIDWGIRFFR